MRTSLIGLALCLMAGVGACTFDAQELRTPGLQSDGAIDSAGGGGQLQGHDGGGTDSSILKTEVPVFRPDAPPSGEVSVAGDSAVLDLPYAGNDGAHPGLDTLSCGSTDAPAGATSSTVTFLNSVATGPLHGHTFVTWGEDEVVTDPVCLPGTYVPSTHGRDCSGGVTWQEGSQLCLSGSDPVDTGDLSYSWGIAMGVNVDSCGDALGRSYTSVSVASSGVPASAIDNGLWWLGVAVLDPGTGATTIYYGSEGKAVSNLGREVPFTEFNTDFWDPSSGTYMTLDQVPNIVSFEVLIVTSPTYSTGPFTDLCVSSITLL